MEPIKTLWMTVGLPRAGKTTWARKTGLPIVCPDAIRLALHGSAFSSQAEPMVWAIARHMVRSLFLAGHNEVVMDATNTTIKRRDEWASDEWVRKFKTFWTPADTCVQRAFDADREVLEPIIERMANQFQHPSRDEYTDRERELES